MNDLQGERTFDDESFPKQNNDPELLEELFLIYNPWLNLVFNSIRKEVRKNYLLRINEIFICTDGTELYGKNFVGEIEKNLFECIKYWFVWNEEELILYVKKFINVFQKFSWRDTSFYMACKTLNIDLNSKKLNKKDLALLLENIDTNNLNESLKRRLEKYKSYVTLGSKFSPYFEIEKGKLLKEKPEYEIIFDLKRAEIKEEFLEQTKRDWQDGNKKLSEIAYDKAIKFLFENSLENSQKNWIFQYFKIWLSLTNEQSILNTIKFVVAIWEFSLNSLDSYDKSFHSCCRKLKIYKDPNIGLVEGDNVDIQLLKLFVENINIDDLSQDLKIKLFEVAGIYF